MKNSRKPKDFHQARWREPLLCDLSVPGHRGLLVPEVENEIESSVGKAEGLIPKTMRRQSSPSLPEISQVELLRHYLRLSQETLGADLDIDIGLGTCTMKYSPKIHETFVRSPKMTALHPDQGENTVQGMLQMIHRLEQFMIAISGMHGFSFQAGGGSQAILANALIVRKYHEERGEGQQRNEIITTMLSHPANAGATAALGYKVINLMPGENGHADYEALEAAISNRTAALFITNPEDTGIFNPRIKEFTDLVHRHGGLCVYDQANLNGLMGITRAVDAGFDLCHYNLHKTFSSPHGSMGPCCGAQGASEALVKYLPMPRVLFDGERYSLSNAYPDSIGKIRKFHGVPPVMLRVYAYILSLGEEGLRTVSELAIINNSYLAKKFSTIKGLSLPYAKGVTRLDQARYSWEKLKEETGVGTLDVCRRCQDYGVQGYFESHHPWLVPEPFTPEPCETYSREDIDEYAAIFEKISEEAYSNPELVKNAPHRSCIAKADESPLADPERLAVTWRAYKKLYGEDSSRR